MDRKNLVSAIDRMTVELREQLSMMTAASQLLERTTTDQGKEHLAVLNRSICRMLRTVSRSELARRLTDADESCAAPTHLDLGSWMGALARHAKDVLAPAGLFLAWDISATPVLFNGDEALLRCMVLEMIDAALSGGDHITMSLSRRGNNVHLDVTAGGNLPKYLREPDFLDGAEEPFSVSLSRQIAQLHGGVMVTCLEGSRFCRLTAILPQREVLSDSRPQKPQSGLVCEGFDLVQVSFSHILPSKVFFSNED